MASRKDLEKNPSLMNRAIARLPKWGIIKLANGGKLDGSGYGGKIHDSHGPECCAQALWIKGIARQNNISDLKNKLKTLKTKVKTLKTKAMKNQIKALKLELKKQKQIAQMKAADDKEAKEFKAA